MSDEKLDRALELCREAEWIGYYHAEDAHDAPKGDVPDADTERTGYYGPDGPQFSRAACWICRPELAPDDATREVAVATATRVESEWQADSEGVEAPDDL